MDKDAENQFTLKNDSFCNKNQISDYVHDLMRSKNLLSPDVYNAAGLSKQTFSYIYSGKVCPSNLHVRQLMFGLQCTLEEAENLLKVCGMSFSVGNRYDDCIKYCLRNGFSNFSDVYSFIADELCKKSA